jgi:hypothetical protein
MTVSHSIIVALILLQAAVAMRSDRSNNLYLGLPEPSMEEENFLDWDEPSSPFLGHTEEFNVGLRDFHDPHAEMTDEADELHESIASTNVQRVTRSGQYEDPEAIQHAKNAIYNRQKKLYYDHLCHPLSMKPPGPETDLRLTESFIAEIQFDTVGGRELRFEKGGSEYWYDAQCNFFTEEMVAKMKQQSAKPVVKALYEDSQRNAYKYNEVVGLFHDVACNWYTREEVQARIKKGVVSTPILPRMQIQKTPRGTIAKRFEQKIQIPGKLTLSESRWIEEGTCEIWVQEELFLGQLKGNILRI